MTRRLLVITGLILMLGAAAFAPVSSGALPEAYQPQPKSAR